MLILEMNHIKKYYGDRLILNVDGFKIYTEDRIGLVGLNGAGKTTFLRLIAGKEEAEAGTVKFFGSSAYIEQLETSRTENYLSGGEKTMARIDAAFAEGVHLLLADEPTSNLSLKNINRLVQKLESFKGGVLLISHDRDLLDSYCNKIIELENGELTEYGGNYTFYKAEKVKKERRVWEDYEDYAAEKERLSERVEQIKSKAKSMKKAPGRVGPSEARLYKGSIKEKAGKVSQHAKMIEGRLNKLEEVKKPVIPPRTKMDMQEGSRLYAKIALEASGLRKSFGSRLLFDNVSFQIKNGSKVALLGENGVGKTTLVRMLMEDEPFIKKAQGLKIAYFSQDLSTLEEGKSIYENVARDCSLTQSVIRSILARMLFFGEDVFKKVALLSGGERVKAALCKIFCRDVNMLVLDEPNNYLDIYSMEALEGLIQDYQGTVLLVSHDRSLIRLAESLLVIENQKVICFPGSYDEYMRRGNGDAGQNTEGRSNALLMLENRLAQLSGLLASALENKEVLEREFMEVSGEIRRLRK